MKTYLLQCTEFKYLRTRDNFINTCPVWHTAKSDPSFEKDENGFLFWQESKDLIFKTYQDAIIHGQSLYHNELVFRVEEIEIIETKAPESNTDLELAKANYWMAKAKLAEAELENYKNKVK